METDINRNSSRQLTGILLVAAGLLLFAYKMGAPVPWWLFTWPVALILVGLLIGLRHRFRNNVWLIFVVVGGLNLIDLLRPDLNFDNYIAPIIIVVVGIVFILRPSKAWRKHSDEWKQNYSEHWKQNLENADTSGTAEIGDKDLKADYIDSVSVFGAVKKVIVSKNFKGGDITCFMGGADINLLQADIQGPVVMEVTQIFGGTKIIIPANWNVKSEVVAVFGNIEDKRPVLTGNINAEKVLVLRGTSVFGGIDIRSY